MIPPIFIIPNMGVEYFPCHTCNEIICDAGDFGSCEICENVLCIDCVKKYKREHCEDCGKLPDQCICIDEKCDCGEKDCEECQDGPLPRLFITQVICKFCDHLDVTDAVLLKFLLKKLKMSKKEAKKEYLSQY